MPKSHAPHAERIAGLIKKSHEKMAASMHADSPTHHVMSGFSDAYRAWIDSVSANPQSLMDLQGKYMQAQMDLWMQAFQPEAKAAAHPVADKRFSGPEWEESPLFRYFRDAYLLTSKMMMQAVDQTDMDAHDKRRMRFFVRQYLDAAAPSNYLATNPEAIKAALESGGKSIEEGLKNLMARHGEGAHLHDRRGGLRGRQEHRRHPGRRRLRERPDPAHPVQPAHREGARAPAGDGAALHQQVLHHGPAARELARALRDRAGPHGVHGVVAQREAAARQAHLGRLPRDGRDRGPRRGARHHGRRQGERARLLHRRHAPFAPRSPCWRRRRRSRWRASRS